MVYRSRMPWGTPCLSIIFGTGGVCVLLSVGILPKLLVYWFINGGVLFNAKFVHVFFCLLARNMWYFSGLFRNVPFLAFLNIVNVLSMLPYACPVSNICQEYPVSGWLFRMAWMCSLYLVLNILPV
jgi:hypothetical protein